MASLTRCVSAGEALQAPTYHVWLNATVLPLTDGIGAAEMLQIFISASPDGYVHYQARSDDLAKALQNFVKQEIAPYKYPRAVQFMDAPPRTQRGKLQRFRLRENEG